MRISHNLDTPNLNHGALYHRCLDSGRLDFLGCPSAKAGKCSLAVVEVSRPFSPDTVVRLDNRKKTMNVVLNHATLKDSPRFRIWGMKTVNVFF
jgi:hypothetical protein